MSTARNARGQATVLTVVFLTALLGMAALVLDVGAWYHSHRETQATADASALAGAQALPWDTGSANSLALQYAGKNGGGLAAADVSITSDRTANDTLKVHVRRTAPGIFSKLFGVDSVNMGATAAARSENIKAAKYVAPMVVFWKHPLLLGGQGCPCFNQPTQLDFDKMGAPGAFGMLNLDGGTGTPGSSEESDWIDHGFSDYLPLGIYRSDPGAKFSSSNVQGALDDRVGSVLLFPVFKTLTDTGQNAEYDIIGWVGFYLTSYTVHGNDATLYGHFTQYIAEGIQSDAGANGQPDFGVRSIQLVQ